MNWSTCLVHPEEFWNPTGLVLTSVYASPEARDACFRGMTLALAAAAQAGKAPDATTCTVLPDGRVRNLNLVAAAAGKLANVADVLAHVRFTAYRNGLWCAMLGYAVKSKADAPSVPIRVATLRAWDPEWNPDPAGRVLHEYWYPEADPATGPEYAGAVRYHRHSPPRCETFVSDGAPQQEIDA